MNFKKFEYLYWLVPILAFLPQLFMSLNSFNQMRFEEFIESVQAPFWFDQRQIISGLHVNVGWYAYLLSIYEIFGFSLYTGKIANLVASFVSTFGLAFLLKRFFNPKVAALILVTIVLSPTLLFINTLNIHWAMTFHLMIIIIALLYLLDFKKKRQSLFLTAAIFLLIMICWFFYQAVAFYIPSLVIFYWLKLKSYNHYKKYKYHILVAAIAFLLPLVMLFGWVDNRHILIADAEVGGGLFRGGGRFEFSEQVFTQAWTDFISDFFVRGVSHHFEVNQAEFSLIFPIISLLFMVYALHQIWRSIKESRKMILLVLLVIVFDIFIFSTTSDLGLPGMKRVTPMLFSIYFLWVVVWYYVRKLGMPKIVAMGILSLLTIHHLIVYPINLSHIKDPSPFKVTDWFEGDNPQQKLEEFVAIAKKENLALDCRPIVAQLGQCSYDFIYPAVAGSCEWNNLDCHQILGYDGKDNKFIPLSLDLWQSKFFDR